MITSSKCEGCVHCRIEKDDADKLEMVHCLEREKRYIFGQYIEPCEEYKREER